MFVALIALGFAPVVTALTHGPGALVAEADHAAWHAEQGDLDRAPHHDASDHDHSTATILPDPIAVEMTIDRRAEACEPFPLGDACRKGPRRPPRAQS